MKLKDISPAAREKLEVLRYDRIVEKHEGPERWSSALRFHDPDFIRIEGRDVLLPIPKEHHRRITILRFIPSDDQSVLTIFLKDTTFADDPEYEMYSAGFLAICERLPGEDFFVATVYHEWFIIDSPDGILPRKACGNGTGNRKARR